MFSLTLISTMPVQPPKTVFSSVQLIAFQLTVVSPVQSLNAFSPINSRVSGRVITVKPEQPSNALLPMRVRFEGRVTEVISAQPLKALSPISETGTP